MYKLKLKNPDDLVPYSVVDMGQQLMDKITNSPEFIAMRDEYLKRVMHEVSTYGRSYTTISLNEDTLRVELRTPINY